MTRSPRHALLFSAAIGGMLLLSACGKDQPATAPSAPAAASTSAPAPAPAPPPATTSSAPAMAQPASAGSSASVAPAKASSAATVAAAPVPPLAVTKLTLGSAVNAEHQVTHAANDFAANDNTLYASVATSGQSSDATINAKWRYLEGKGQLVSNISQSIATDGPALTTFKVHNPDLWPEGKYEVEISLNGKPVAKQDFEIKKS